VDVVHGGGRPDEALGAEELFGVEHAVGAAELDVALLGEQAELRVIGHGSSATVVIPRALAAPTARAMFTELPLVDRTINTSPGLPSASTARLKICSNP
jgi:hypothetical protein